jgi:putrescine transport system permease protein
MSRFTWFNATALTFGFAFLYLPMVILIVYSFNESRLVTVWAGFSTKWYGELIRNEQFLDAAWVTLRVAFFSASIATVLGTMAAYVLVRGGRFFGRTLFSGMIYAPLVMPEVITGLSLLLLFISINLDRGIVTIILAHTTFCMAYVAVVVSARLVSFDRSVEEAALDLGATPFDAFRSVTLPIIMPAVVSGWLLGFTLSLDDLVIASFTAGPAATTLPIQIFSSVRLGVSPEINALSTILIGIVAVGVVAASLISKRNLVRQARDARRAIQAEAAEQEARPA